MANLPVKLTAEQLKDLTTKHLERYVGMIHAAPYDASINMDECKALLRIWTRIWKRDASLVSSDYQQDEIEEIQDAWFDEYDEMENVG